jgi:hypothetical protein
MANRHNFNGAHQYITHFNGVLQLTHEQLAKQIRRSHVWSGTCAAAIFQSRYIPVG